MDCSPSGPTVHGILQARILEWVSIPFSRSYSNSQILFLKLSEVGNRLWGSLTGHYCRTMHVSRLCFWDGVPAVSFPCSKFWPCPALIRAQLPEQVAQTASQPTWLVILLLECSLRSLTATSSLLHSQALENNAYECGLPLWMGKTSIFNPGSLCTVQPTTLRHWIFSIFLFSSLYLKQPWEFYWSSFLYSIFRQPLEPWFITDCL